MGKSSLGALSGNRGASSGKLNPLSGNLDCLSGNLKAALPTMLAALPPDLNALSPKLSEASPNRRIAPNRPVIDRFLLLIDRFGRSACVAERVGTVMIGFEPCTCPVPRVCSCCSAAVDAVGGAGAGYSRIRGRW